ncbi:DUF4232 domain-containing protein [Streptomyces sp. NBC_01260]|uniref:DUF4232 domain-containing protein n=1 Tax=unclassified Streptomyces TaxID=2593676 RepID=UPI000F4A1435|nr:MULTISPECIES: DUF4232 domain-containing protein [unclassified Streptomyces]MCX4771783.1 DUF4232 domain-containing protein [Streptomyces sp. NBC_01285]ROQ80862.1 uncharacterized protein DUF4232 [Streptomyces sp. CEV 2-1]
MRSNRIRTTALAATALLAALSLTACSGDSGSSESSKAGAAAPVAHTIDKQATSQPESQSQPQTAAPEEGATDAPAANSGTKTGGSGSGTTKNTAPPATSDGKNTSGSTDKAGNTAGPTSSSTKTVTCTGSNTKVTVTKVSRPINHLLLTVTNAGSQLCNAYYAPKLRFDDAQAVFPILEDSQPQAVVTLEPGQSAYAAIGLTGEPGSGPAPRKGSHLQVNFAGKNPVGSTGAPAELTLPANTYWDDNGFVTYWQTEMADALQY